MNHQATLLLSLFVSTTCIAAQDGSIDVVSMFDAPVRWGRLATGSGEPSIHSGLESASSRVERCEPVERRTIDVLELLALDRSASSPPRFDPLLSGNVLTDVTYTPQDSSTERRTTVSISGSLQALGRDSGPNSGSTNYNASGLLSLGHFFGDALELRASAEGSIGWTNNSNSYTGSSSLGLQLKWWSDRNSMISLYAGPQVGLRFGPDGTGDIDVSPAIGVLGGINVYVAEDRRDVSVFFEGDFRYSEQGFGDMTTKLYDTTFRIGVSMWF